MVYFFAISTIDAINIIILLFIKIKFNSTIPNNVQ